MRHDSLGWLGRVLVIASVLVLLAHARVRAEERYFLLVEADAAQPLAAPQSALFGTGAGGAATLGVSLDDHVATALRLEGGVLSEGGTPPNHLAAAGVGGWGAATLALRLRPLGDAFGEHRRTTGLVIELGAGGAVTGMLVHPAFEATLSWGFAVGDVVVAPALGVTHLLAWDPLDGVGGLVGRVGLALVFGDEARVPRLDATPSDRDEDGLLDPDDFCPDDAEDRDGFEDADGCPDLDDDADAIPDSRDACVRVPEDYDGHDDEDGCPEDEQPLSDRDGDGFPDVSDVCPDEAEVINGVADDDGCPDEGLFVLRGDRVVLDDRVLFEYGRARVIGQGHAILAAVVHLFQAHPEWDRVRVEGHTDEHGTPEFNLRLSERRARAVRAVLVTMGLDPSRIETAGFGETRLVDHGTSAEAQQRNRRVELVMIDDGAAPTTPVEDP